MIPNFPLPIILTSLLSPKATTLSFALDTVQFQQLQSQRPYVQQVQTMLFLPFLLKSVPTSLSFTPLPHLFYHGISPASHPDLLFLNPKRASSNVVSFIFLGKIKGAQVAEFQWLKWVGNRALVSEGNTRMRALESGKIQFQWKCKGCSK